jgi:hypothetical protein
MRKTMKINSDCSKYLKIEYLYLYNSGGGGGSAARLKPLSIIHFFISVKTIKASPFPYENNYHQETFKLIFFFFFFSGAALFPFISNLIVFEVEFRECLYEMRKS